MCGSRCQDRGDEKDWTISGKKTFRELSLRREKTERVRDNNWGGKLWQKERDGEEENDWRGKGENGCCWSERQTLKNRVSRLIKQTQNDVVLVIRREKIKKLLLWVEPGLISGIEHVLAARIPGTFLRTNYIYFQFDFGWISVNWTEILATIQSISANFFSSSVFCTPLYKAQFHFKIRTEILPRVLFTVVCIFICATTIFFKKDWTCGKPTSSLFNC